MCGYDGAFCEERKGVSRETGAIGEVRPCRYGADEPPLLQVDHLRKYFPIKGGILYRTQALVQAVDDVSLAVHKGEILGIVGESGCGKSTTARLILHLIKADEGEVAFGGKPVAKQGGIAVRELQRQVQMVFQDSYSSLNPRLPIQASIAFGPMVHGVPVADARQRALQLLQAVGVDPRLFARRYPHELSGGQRQRVNIARALAFEPKLVIFDEAVSALDKSVQAQVLNLLLDLKDQFDLTYLFISHDLNVVQYVSDRVMVMYLGKVVETGTVEAVYNRPGHPYTRALLSAVPSMDPDNRTYEMPLIGDPPNPIQPPSGCRFRTRCSFAEDVCARDEPELADAPGVRCHAVACHMRDPASGHSRATAGGGSPQDI